MFIPIEKPSKGTGGCKQNDSLVRAIPLRRQSTRALKKRGRQVLGWPCAWREPGAAWRREGGNPGVVCVVLCVVLCVCVCNKSRRAGADLACWLTNMDYPPKKIALITSDCVTMRSLASNGPNHLGLRARRRSAGADLACWLTSSALRCADRGVLALANATSADSGDSLLSNASEPPPPPMCGEMVVVESLALAPPPAGGRRILRSAHDARALRIQMPTMCARVHHRASDRGWPPEWAAAAASAGRGASAPRPRVDGGCRAAGLPSPLRPRQSRRHYRDGASCLKGAQPEVIRAI